MVLASLLRAVPAIMGSLGWIMTAAFALVKQWQYKWWAYIVRGEIETSFVTSGFTAAQFGNTTSTFSSGPEFLTRAAVVIDLTPIIWR